MYNEHFSTKQKIQNPQVRLHGFPGTQYQVKISPVSRLITRLAGYVGWQDHQDLRLDDVGLNSSSVIYLSSHAQHYSQVNLLKEDNCLLWPLLLQDSNKNMEMMKFYVSLQDFFQSSYTGNLKEVALIIGFTLLFLVALSTFTIINPYINIRSACYLIILQREYYDCCQILKYNSFRDTYWSICS